MYNVVGAQRGLCRGECLFRFTEGCNGNTKTAQLVTNLDLSAINVMTSYPVAQYQGDSQQHETYNEPPQFDPYNLHRPQESYDLNLYREPYRDEPSNPLPQVQPVQSLAPVTKEESGTAFSPDEFAPPSRKVPCVASACTLAYSQFPGIGVPVICVRGDTSRVAHFGHR